MHEKRLNSPKRLDNAARFVGLAMKRGCKLAFTHTNRHGVGVSDIIESGHEDYVIGVLYEIPNEKMPRLDQIEGVNSGAYKRVDDFTVTKLDASLKDVGEQIEVSAYTVVKKEERPRTNSEYANHILEGIREHRMGGEYFITVRNIILDNNPNIEGDLACYSHC